MTLTHLVQVQILTPQPKTKERKMDVGSGEKYPAGALSNFTPRKFEVRGIPCNSMEGFLQGLKFKNPDMQKEVFSLVGIKAKRKGSKKNWQRTQTLWFQGEPIARSSKEYQDLIDEAYDALFSNEKAKKTLLASGDANLTHSIGKRDAKKTVLTEREFCSRLMRIRSRLQSEES